MRKLLILLLLCSLFAIYVSIIPSYCVVDEDAWNQSYVRGRITALQLKFLFKGIRLKHVTLDISQISDKQKFISSMEKISEAEIIVLDPVVSYACNTFDIDAKSVLKIPCVSAITGDNSKGYFNCILVSDEDSAWAQVEYKEDVVICRSTDDISSYLNDPDFNKSLIVDYRIAGAVPDNMLYGVIEPDLEEAFKYQSGEVKLNYEFRKTRRKIF